MGRDVSLSRAFRRTRRYKQGAAELGARVKELRKAQGWTLEKASAQMGLDFRHLQLIEAGTVNVTLATILRISDAFEVSPFVILPGAKETKREPGTRSSAATSTKSKLGARVLVVPAITVADSPGPRHPGQVMENPIERPPVAELADLLKRVGSAIKQQRLGKGLTQVKLAKVMGGVAVQYVQAVEGGKQNLTIESILKFARALGVDPREFW